VLFIAGVISAAATQRAVAVGHQLTVLNRATPFSALFLRALSC